MKRLDSDGEGSTPQIGIRLPQKTTERLDALIAGLPNNIIGPLPRATVLRAVIDAGIDAIAAREGINLGDGATPKPNGKGARKETASVAKTSDGKTVHRASRARAERRAEARRKAGCTCKGKHVPTCKLYRHRSDTAA
jgi:hypothetical protein